MSSLLSGWSIDPDVDARTTLGRMARLVQKALMRPATIYAANQVIAVPNARDYPGQIAAIRSFMLRRFRFVGNPLGIDGQMQQIKPAVFMLDDIDARGFTQGACDDAAVLIATLGMASALPARFRAIAFCDSRSACDGTEPFSHVIADLYDGERWVPLDVTKPLDLDRPPLVAREMVYAVS